MTVDLPGPAATEAFGADLARALRQTGDGALITLAGELGAGKTALVRAVIRALGHDGPVVSPSFTLVEPYDLDGRRIYHLDLYRLGDPEELEYLGLRELSPETNWVFIEWADRGRGFLPAPDLALTLAYRGSGRCLRAETHSSKGRAILVKLQYFNHGNGSGSS